MKKVYEIKSEFDVFILELDGHLTQGEADLLSGYFRELGPFYISGGMLVFRAGIKTPFPRV
jgi:hypothetical protein